MSSTRSLVILMAVVAIAAGVHAEPGEIGGMLSMNPVLEESYAAIWVPVPDNQAVTGVRWYNNDGTVVFPRVLVASGTADQPVGLEGAVVVASDVQGESLAWSEVVFDQAYACEHEGIYCLFVFPAGSEYSAPGYGGGAAIGHTDGAGGHEGWLCADMESWMKIDGDNGLAIAPILVEAEPGMIRMAQPRGPAAAEAFQTRLHRARPNPFNPQTVVEYTLNGAQHVDLAVYDLRGRLVRQLEHGERAAGIHSVVWRGQDDHGRRMPTGAYLVRFVAGSHQQSERILLVK